MKNRLKHIFSKKWFWAGALFVQILLFYFLSKVGFFVSLNESFFEFQKAFHQRLFSSLAFSLGDLLYISFILFILVIIFNLTKKEKRKIWQKTLFITLNIFYFTYQIFWGMLYFQKPMIDILPKREVDEQKLKILAKKYLELTKISRKLVKENSHGVFVIQDLNSAKDAIIGGQNKIPNILSNRKSTSIKSLKPSIFSQYMSYVGVLGYYNPFTTEAQYNKNMPDSFLLFTLAHESAHQLGIARESEAHFIAYLIGIHSNNIELKHSIHWFSLKNILGNIVQTDPKFTQEIVDSFSKEMKRDWIYEKEFIQKHQSGLTVFFDKANDLFLKSNQQEGAVTYKHFVNLLVAYEG